MVLAATLGLASVLGWGFLSGCAHDAADDANATGAETARDELVTTTDAASNAEASANEQLPFAVEDADLDSIPSDDALVTFSLTRDDAGADSAAFDLSSDARASLEAPLAAMTVEVDCDASIVFIDVQSGNGIAYNADYAVYGASAYKAPYALYVCESQLETGRASLSSYCAWEKTSGTVQSMAEQAVLYSDNESFFALRAAFDKATYGDWIESLGATDELAIDPMSDFPIYSARTAAKLWREMLLYLDTGSEYATWLGGLLQNTSISYIRGGVQGAALQAGMGEGVTVYNKAGWIAEGPGYESTSDAAIIRTADGSTYLMCIMSDQAYSDASAQRVANMAAALFNVREELA